jgi:hypothetical protein
MRTLLVALLAAAVASPASARDLGSMPFSGRMALDWVAREDDGAGGFTARYAIRGGLDDDGEDAALLAGFSLACEGTLTLARGLLVDDHGTCSLSDAWGNRATMRYQAGPCAWGSHALAVTVSGITGPYAHVFGSGTVARGMLLPPENASPWGVFAGKIAWRLD